MTRQPYPHQPEGERWLAGAQHRMLASDPGLGKTYMAVRAADAALASRILVVCPATARPVWIREIEAFQEYPRRVTECVTGADVKRLGKAAPPREEWAVIAWGQTPEAHRRWPLSLRFDVMILDEGHYAKNPEAERTRGIYGAGCKSGGLMLRVGRVWVLTGTPALSGPHELWPHYRALWPEAMGTERPYSYSGWLDTFCDVQPTLTGEQVRGIKKGKAAELRAAFAPYILRQRKTKGMLPDLRAVETPVRISGAEAAEVKRLVAELGLFDATLAQVQAILDETGDDVVHLATLRRVLGAAKAKPSAELIRTDLESGVESAVVFAWHRDTLDRLEHELAPLGVIRLDGRTPMTKRKALIDRFQSGDRKARVFLGQITSAGVAITLTRACDVYMVEQAWTPAENAQAIQRCHRIGQTRPVLARLLFAEGTVDAALSAILTRKAKTIMDLGLN